jgi:NADH:ubiquinone oxidoreductase subunit F (NADH-binding)
MSLERPVPEYSAACCHPCREGQINALYRIQTIAAQFIHHTKNFDWETVVHLRTIASLCALFKAYCRERAWKAISDRLRWPHYLSRVDSVRKISYR